MMTMVVKKYKLRRSSKSSRDDYYYYYYYRGKEKWLESDFFVIFSRVSLGDDKRLEQFLLPVDG
jgi:hypothetical protein